MVKNNNLEANGWKRMSIGHYRNSRQIKEIEGYFLYVRNTAFDDFLKKSSFSALSKTPKNPVNTRISEWGSKEPMGNPEKNLTPLQSDKVAAKFSGCRNSGNLPELAHFADFRSLVSIRPDKPCILIGYDSEWQNLPEGRNMLSWQFTVIWNERLIEFCFLKNCDKNLDLDLALGCILDYLGVMSLMNGGNNYFHLIISYNIGNK